MKGPQDLALQYRQTDRAENCLAARSGPLHPRPEQNNPPPGWLQDLPDDSILQLCAADPNAIWTLWFRHKERLERMLRSIASLSQWDLEEILSAAALRLHAQIPRHALSIRNLPGWMSALVRNVAMDYLRKEQRFRQTHLQFEDEDGSPQEVLDPKWMQSCDPVLQQMMHSGLKSLSDRLRETAVAHLLEGKSYSEIARTQRVSPAVVRKRIQTAREQLRHIVKSYPSGPFSLNGEKGRTRFIGPEHALRPKFVIERCPVSSRILPVPGPQQEGRFHHFFFSHSVARLEQKLRTLQAYAAHHLRGWSKQLELAEQNLSAGHWDAAFDGFQVCRQHPAQALPSFLRLAQMSRLHGRMDESLWFYREALRGEQDPATQRHLEALMADLQGMKAEAQELWKAASSIEPENPAHYLAAAEALKQDDADERTGPLLHQALQLGPGNLEARNFLLDILARNGEHGPLIAQVDRLYLEDRNAQVICYYANFRLTKAGLTAEQSDHVRRLIGSGLKKTPGFPGLLDTQAAYYAVSHQWKRLNEHLDKLVLDYPARAECWKIRAVWLARLHRPGISDSIRQAVILAPSNPRILEAALYLAIRSNNPGLFREIMNELPEAGNHNSRLLLAAASGLLVFFGNHLAALDMARVAATSHPHDPLVQFGLGRLLRLSGHTHAAISMFYTLWESIEQRPQHVLAPAVALQIGKCMAASGEREQTLRWCAMVQKLAEQFADIDPRAAAAWNKTAHGIQSGDPAVFGSDNEIWDSMPVPDPFV